MCLYLTKWYHKIPRISFKPIKVYKVLVKNGNNYETCFRRTPIKLDGVIKAKGNFFKDTCKGVLLRALEGSYIHYFTNIDSALDYSMGTKFYVFEAYIPPFTLYFKGKYGEGAARKLLITSKKTER